jgi:hypothetical protein
MRAKLERLFLAFDSMEGIIHLNEGSKKVFCLPRALAVVLIVSNHATLVAAHPSGSSKWLTPASLLDTTSGYVLCALAQGCRSGGSAFTVSVG